MEDRNLPKGQVHDTVFPCSCPPWGGTPMLCLSLRYCGPWEPVGQL